MKPPLRSHGRYRDAPPGASRTASSLLLALAWSFVAACDDTPTDAVRAGVASDGGRDARPLRESTNGDSGAPPDGRSRANGGPRDGGTAPDAAETDARAAHDSDAGGDTGVVGDASVDAPGDTGLEASIPVSVRCGDGVRGLDEECDDGNADDTDFCTAVCRVRDRIAVGPTEPPATIAKHRGLPQGQHVVAAGRSGAALLFVDESADPETLGVVVFGKDGKRPLGDAGVVVSDTDPLYDPVDAHVVALPSNRYAVVWTASGGPSLHIALRIVDGTTGTMTNVLSPNSQDYSAQGSDAVWTGSELVLAWTASESGGVSNRIATRRYDATGTALADESFVEPSRSNEALPTLVPFANGYATAWVERDANFTVSYVARAGDEEWRVGPFPNSGSTGPALATLDSRHLLLVVPPLLYDADAGEERAALFGAVLDASAPGDVTPFPIQPLAESLAADPTRDARFPGLVVAGGSAYVAWTVGPGRASFGTKLVLKEMPWRSGSLDRSQVELALPRDAERQGGFQFYPALAASPWPFGGALFAAWEDDDRTFGLAERLPDVVAGLVPLPIARFEPREAGHD